MGFFSQLEKYVIEWLVLVCCWLLEIKIDVTLQKKEIDSFPPHGEPKYRLSGNFATRFPTPRLKKWTRPLENNMQRTHNLHRSQKNSCNYLIADLSMPDENFPSPNRRYIPGRYAPSGVGLRKSKAKIKRGKELRQGAKQALKERFRSRSKE